MIVKRSTQGSARLAAYVATLLACAPSRAQIPPSPLQPVDPMVEDVSPLSASFRDMQVDLRQPLGFKQVYRIPGSEGQVDQYMRASGAVYATFPLSAYRTTDEGVQVLIPAGTVFHIGAPWLVFGLPPSEVKHAAPPPGSVLTRMNSTLLSTTMTAEHAGSLRDDAEDVNDWNATPPMRHPWSLRMAAMNEELHDQAEIEARFGTLDGPLPPTVVNDPIYRAQRLTALLRQAAQEEKRQSDAASPTTDGN